MERFDFSPRPRLLLAFGHSAHLSTCGRYFRRLGWEVRLAASGSEARRLVSEFQPRVLVVEADLPDETGWLTCAKIALDRPPTRMILVVPQRDAEALKRMDFIGLDGVVARAEGAEGLAEVILDHKLARMLA